MKLKRGSKLQNDRYVISDYLGSGGFGIVWRATATKEGRDVAIKRMIKQNGDENKRLLDEARKISALKGHKNIVEVYEVLELDGEGFLVMEHVDGDSLEVICKKHVQNRTWVDQEEALDYLKQSIHGLLFAHSSGLVSPGYKTGQHFGFETWCREAGRLWLRRLDTPNIAQRRFPHSPLDFSEKFASFGCLSERPEPSFIPSLDFSCNFRNCPARLLAHLCSLAPKIGVL